MLFSRKFLLPWLFSALVMLGLNYLWHGLVLNDLEDVRLSTQAYLAFAGGAYLLIGLLITGAVHWGIQTDRISLKHAFPWVCMAVGGSIGVVVYLVAYFFGLSFSGRELVHVVADTLWQMVEQALGGLAVSLGIIYDMHRTFMHTERAS